MSKKDVLQNDLVESVEDANEANLEEMKKKKLTKEMDNSDEDDSDEEEDDDDDETYEESFKEDLDALVNSEATLSESFRAKAEVIFEAALNSKLAAAVDRLEEDYAERLSEEVASLQATVVEQLDGYLNYVVEAWMVENKLAVDTGLRNEIAESFINSLKDVFVEHYVEVPESKVDLVDELSTKVAALEEKYNASVDKNIELTESVKKMTREKVVVEASEGLSVAQAEKLKSLVEDVAYTDADKFAAKVQTLKESYFKKAAVVETAEETLNESTDQVSVSPQMSKYLAALKKSK